MTTKIIDKLCLNTKRGSIVIVVLAIIIALLSAVKIDYFESKNPAWGVSFVFSMVAIITAFALFRLVREVCINPERALEINKKKVKLFDLIYAICALLAILIGFYIWLVRFEYPPKAFFCELHSTTLVCAKYMHVYVTKIEVYKILYHLKIEQRASDKVLGPDFWASMVMSVAIGLRLAKAIYELIFEERAKKTVGDLCKVAPEPNQENSR